ncbi:hypothetical protein M5F45_07685, partial [Salmonella enterica]|nr:hypothetical protein [Salmonella enterica]
MESTSLLITRITPTCADAQVFFVYGKPPARLGVPESFQPVIKTPFDLLKHLAVWQLQKFNKKS